MEKTKNDNLFFLLFGLGQNICGSPWQVEKKSSFGLFFCWTFQALGAGCSANPEARDDVKICLEEIENTPFQCENHNAFLLVHSRGWNCEKVKKTKQSGAILILFYTIKPFKTNGTFPKGTLYRCKKLKWACTNNMNGSMFKQIKCYNSRVTHCDWGASRSISSYPASFPGNPKHKNYRIYILLISYHSYIKPCSKLFIL